MVRYRLWTHLFFCMWCRQPTCLRHLQLVLTGARVCSCCRPLVCAALCCAMCAVLCDVCCAVRCALFAM